MKKTIFKRILCVFFAVFILAALAIPAAADTYTSEISCPALMWQYLSSYSSQSEDYVFFVSDNELSGGLTNGNGMLSYFGSSYVTPSGDNSVSQNDYNFDYEFYPGEMTFYIFLEVEGFDVVLRSDDEYSYIHVYERARYQTDDFMYISFTNDTLEMLPNAGFVSGDCFTHSSSSSNPAYLPQLRYSTYYDEFTFDVSYDYGNASTSYSVTGWFCVCQTMAAAHFMEYLVGDEFVFSSGSGTTDPGNNSGSGSGTSDPGETPSTPVTEEEEAVTVLSSLRDFVFSIFMAPSIFLSSILDFTILGINLYTVVKVILTLCLVAFVVALVVKLILHLR